VSKPRQRDHIPLLSKSRFLSGLQCLKRLYLESYQSYLAAPASVTERARMETGNRVEELARQRYSDGFLVEHCDALPAAAKETETILSRGNTGTLFQAGFLCDGVGVKTDILTRGRGTSWDLIEVKSSSKVKDTERLPDLAIQLHVLRGAGMKIRKAQLMHLNSDYVFGGGEYDLEELFIVEDLTEDANDFQSEIPDALDEMKAVLRGRKAPDISVGKHCSSPDKCPFFDYCRDESIEYPVLELPRVRQELLDRFEEAGIEEIKDIPQGFLGLSPLQERVRDVVASGKPFFDPQIRKELQKAVYPIRFLDFETFAPALPLYSGTSPYQTIPFQWSDHIMGKNGTLEHREFLYDRSDDPRPAFIKSLLKVLGDKGSIVVYSPYEATILKALARDSPRHEKNLLSLLERILDLLPLVRNNVYHPDFHGSFSIKAVLPALVPEMSYDGLRIQDGMHASVAYSEMAESETEPSRKAEIRKSLLKYCEMDTKAMVRLFETLIISSV